MLKDTSFSLFEDRKFTEEIISNDSHQHYNDFRDRSIPMKIHRQTFSTSKVKNRKVTKRIISFLELFFDWKTMFRFMKYAKSTAKHQAIVFAIR